MEQKSAPKLRLGSAAVLAFSSMTFCSSLAYTIPYIKLVVGRQNSECTLQDIQSFVVFMQIGGRYRESNPLQS